MKTNEEINKTLRDTVKSILGIENEQYYLVIKENINAPRPRNPHCIVKVLSTLPLSEEEVSRVGISDTEVEVTYKALRKIIASFSFYRESDDDTYGDPMYLASKVRLGLTRPSSLSVLDSGGLGVMKRGTVKNITQRIDNGFEPRANLTVEFSLVDTDTETIEIIESVTMEGTLETPSGNLETSIEINN